MLSLIVIPLAILWAFLHGRYLRVKSDVPQMLMSDPRQCCAFFRQLGNARHKASLEEFHRQLSASLPPLTKEDRL